MRALALATVLLSFGAASASAAPATGPMRGEIFLRVNEASSRFDVPTRQLIVRPGVEKFKVAIPRTAKGRHGVAINGGPYRNIEGVSVKPGRTTSLTVGLSPGKYTIYDPYRHNRKLGFYVKITVLPKQGGKFEPGTPCAPTESFVTGPAAWVNGVDCGVVEALSEELDERWEASGYAFDPITVNEFVCTFSPFARTGMTITCLAGERRVVFAGYANSASS